MSNPENGRTGRAPEVSVLIPTYNGARWILGTIRSILDQEGVRVQVIVSDDGSTDSTPELVARLSDPRIVLTRTQGSGIAAGLNTALALATAPLVGRCDHDDWYTPGRLKSQVAFLCEHPEFGATCGQFETTDKHGRVLSEMGSGDADAEITGELRSGQIRTHQGTWLWRTSIARDIGGFRHLGVLGEDLDFQYRFGERARVWYRARVVYRFRLRPSSTSNAASVDERSRSEWLACALQRQRMQTGADDLARGVEMPAPDDLFPPPEESFRERIYGILCGSGWRELERRRRLTAVWQAARAVRWLPEQPEAWRNLAAVMVRSLSSAKAVQSSGGPPVELPTYTVRRAGVADEVTPAEQRR